MKLREVIKDIGLCIIGALPIFLYAMLFQLISGW